MTFDMRGILKAKLYRLWHLYESAKFGPLGEWADEEVTKLEAEILDYINRNPREALHKIVGMAR